MNIPTTINLEEKLSRFTDHWNPRIIGRYNGNELRVAKVMGDFTWHRHEETDELFLVVKGELGIEFRGETRRYKAGEMVVVPKGMEHRPFAENECHIMLMDREGESNTGRSPPYRTQATLNEL